MTNLKELESRYTELKGRIEEISTGIKERREQAEKRLPEIEVDLTDLALKIEEADKLVFYAKGISELEKDDAKKAQYEADYEQYQKNLEDLKDQRSKLIEEKNKLLAPEPVDELQNCQKELDEIINTFVRDPRLNQHLQEMILNSYSQKISKHENVSDELFKKINSMSEKLKDANVFGDKLEEIKKIKEELNTFNPNSLDREEIKKWQSVRKDYFNKVNELKKAILSDPEFSGMKLENRDLQAIIDGEYVIPSWNDRLDEENKVIEQLEKEKTAKIAKIESLKKSPADMNLEKEYDETVVELDEVSKKVFSKQSRYQDLLKATSVPADLSFKAEKDKLELEKARETLKGKGFISTRVFPDLKDSSSELAKKFKEFTEADKKVRETFYECLSASPFGSRNIYSKDSDKALKEKIAEFQAIAEELSSMSGMKIEDWHDYLLRTLETKSKSGEEIDQVYFDSTLSKKLDKIKSDYPDVTEEHTKAQIRFEMLEAALKNKRAQMECILSGKTDDDEIDLKHYRDSVNDLSDAINDNVAADDLFDIMRINQVDKNQTRFSRFKDFFKNIFKKKEKFESGIEYDDETIQIASSLPDLITAAEESESELSEYIDQNISMDDVEELKQLRYDRQLKDSLEAKKQSLESEMASRIPEVEEVSDSSSIAFNPKGKDMAKRVLDDLDR